jgi:hypothetical protein
MFSVKQKVIVHLPEQSFSGVITQVGSNGWYRICGAGSTAGSCVFDEWFRDGADKVFVRPYES